MCCLCPPRRLLRCSDCLKSCFGRATPYLTIENGKIDIDAEMMLDMDDIESVKQFNFWGCRMLGLKIANPEKYRFSWRFKADRMFHKDYRAFICVDMVRKDEQPALLDLFKDKTV